MDVQTQIMNLLDDVAPTPEQMSAQLENLQRDNVRLQSNWEAARSRADELNTKINNVRGHIADIYSMNGELDEDIKIIAEYLDIELTKEITGEATFHISFTAKVPLDFDPENFELSFSVDCDTYEADEFEWNEESTDIDCEDEF